MALVCASCGGGPSVAIERIERDADGNQAIAVVLTADVEIADTASARARGLRDSAPLATGEGLLLVFPAVLDDVCIDNRGVGFAIDAVIAGGGGLVTGIEREIPADDDGFRCYDGVAYILELGAGEATPVRAGDRLRVRL